MLSGMHDERSDKRRGWIRARVEETNGQSRPIVVEYAEERKGVDHCEEFVEYLCSSTDTAKPCRPVGESMNEIREKSDRIGSLIAI